MVIKVSIILRLAFYKKRALIDQHSNQDIMPAKRFELSLSHLNSDLNAARLPIPPSGLKLFNYHTKIFGKIKYKNSRLTILGKL